MTDGKLLWWQRAIIYQIYPRSFADSNGDGIGDLRGIISKLDYLSSVGVEAIWLSPIFPSPMADFGYDVANYVDIDPMFGTLNDFDDLLAAVHSRDMKLILDLVPNHTSDEHPWFVESRQSKENPKRDWYIWRDPAPDGGPPNNWVSFFGGSAWTLDEKTGQYYLHQFLPQQPELNWRNADVRKAIQDVIVFWLGRGVDGFRVDVIWCLGKDEALRDEPANPDYEAVQGQHNQLLHIYTQDHPDTHGYIQDMRTVFDEFSRNTGRERVMIGEIYLPFERLVRYYGTAEKPECHMPFNFSLLLHNWQAPVIKQLVNQYEQHVGDGWPNWVLGNHDNSRIASRVGLAQARVANMLLLTLRGTPTCYYGDELGMQDVPIPVDQWRDPAALRQPEAPSKNRDPERTPMQWDASTHAGFCDISATPWLPVASNSSECNVSVQTGQKTSFLEFFRSLSLFRRDSKELLAGKYTSVNLPAEQEADVFAYTRSSDSATLLVLLNMSANEHILDLSATGARGVCVLNTHEHAANDTVTMNAFRLLANQGVVLRVE